MRARAALKLAAGCGLLAVSSALVTTDVTARYTVPKLGLRPAEPAAQSLHLHSTGTAQDLAPARELQRYIFSLLSLSSLSLSLVSVSVSVSVAFARQLQRYTCSVFGGCIVTRACQSISVEFV